MKLLKIDFNEIQKAMEDVSRDAFDYFLDIETGSVVTISVDALERVKGSLYKGDELIDESSLEAYDMPEWIEDEVELAIRIFSEKQRYVRIPERESKEVYALMKKFTEGIDELRPHDELSDALNSHDSFSRFKKTLSIFPEYKKKWFALNAGAMRKTITEWLASIGIKPEQGYY
ncbi:MAG: hypothetical protein C4550_01670 [Nitrospiraceae bacterium]|nr:MAG: hypothetical protein C4550_01670 [Nitrospiraceae bacterium]